MSGESFAITRVGPFPPRLPVTAEQLEAIASEIAALRTALDQLSWDAAQRTAIENRLGGMRWAFEVLGVEVEP